MFDSIISGFVKITNSIGSFLWGPWTQIFLIIAGLWFTIGTKFYPFRKFGTIMKKTMGTMFKKQPGASKNRLSSVQAVLGALAGTIGMGNIAGTASAIAIGGPGAVFWMWVFAFLGMSLKMAEVTLAVHYREVGPDGKTYGGPMYYMRKALNSKLLAYLFCFGLFFNCLFMAATMQTHTIAESLQASYGVNPYITAVIVCLLTLIAILGGLKAIGKTCETLVPIMTIIWIVSALIVLFTNITEVPRVFGNIISEAFVPTAAVGGFAGSTIALAIKQGAARGTGSNDAGVGVAPCIHATAEVDHPFSQGLWGSTEVFIDTILVCSMTAFIILAPSDVWYSGETGVTLTLMGLQSALPAGVADLIVNLCVAAFCFSTVLVFFVYYETASVYLFGQKAFKAIKWLYFIVPIIFAGYSKVNDLWGGFANIASALCLLPNLIALLLLSRPYFKLLKDYEGERKYTTAYTDKTKDYVKVHPAYQAEEAAK